MKKIVYIASLISFSLLLGCEKSAIEDAVDSKLDTTSQRSVGELSGSSIDDGSPIITTNSDEAQSVNQSLIDIEVGDDIVPDIKEVSDGDDEADGGDDSQTSE
ncbi:MAG: hypothetical protein R2813_08160 [Flavobacteriales bacterium]